MRHFRAHYVRRHAIVRSRSRTSRTSRVFFFSRRFMACARARLRGSGAPEGWAMHHSWVAGCPNARRMSECGRSVGAVGRSSVPRRKRCASRASLSRSVSRPHRASRVRRRGARGRDDDARDGDRVRHRGRALRVWGLVSQERAVRRDPGLDFPARWVHVCDDVRGDEFDVDVDVV